MQLLLAINVDADSKDYCGRTPLLQAAEHEAIVQLLLATGKVNADSKEESGLTPLWFASRNGHEGIVKLLLATSKVDTNTKGYNDQAKYYTV